MTAKEKKKALSAKSYRPSIPEEDFLSTGLTLLDLAISHGRNGFGIPKGSYVWYVGDSESGKAQPLGCQVLTPSGWVRMGDLKVGDRVIDPDGGTGAVEGVYPQGKKKVYRVDTTDGGSTYCCKEHLWLTRGKDRGGRKQPESVKSLDQISNTLTFPSGKSGYDTHRHAIPLTVSVEFDHCDELPILPYLLGVLLGNGHFGASVKLSTSDKEILEKVKASLPRGVVAAERSPGNYDLVATRGKPNPLQIRIKALGLAGTRASSKFIPDDYLRSSVEDRVRLLNGLLDTDGTCCPRGAVEYSTSSLKLANGVRELVWSLGGKATVRAKLPRYTYLGEKKTGAINYTLAISLPNTIPAFSLSRKADRREHCKFQRLERKIKSITPSGVRECQCIKVSTKRNLYVTDDYIVTHNTFLSLQCFAEAVRNKSFKNHRLIFDNVEKGAHMDLEEFFGSGVADRVEAPRMAGKEPVHSETVEEFYDHLDDAIKDGRPFIYALDSMDSLEAKADRRKYEEAKAARRKGSGKDPAGSYGMSKAKANSDNLKRISGQLSKTGSILLIISQTRDDVGSPIPGSKKASGGHSLRFWANVQIWTKVKGPIRKNVLGKDRVVGSYIEFAVRKNRINGRRTMKVSVPFHPHNGVGFDDTGACVDFLVDEGRWDRADKGGVITAPQFDFKGTREKLIRKIEEDGEEGELKTLVREVWGEIDSSCAVVRKRRYE